MRYEGPPNDRYRNGDDWRPSGDRYDEYSPSKDRYRRGRANDSDHRGEVDTWTPQYDSHATASNNLRMDDYGDVAGHSSKQSWEPPVRHDDKDADFSRWSPKDRKSGKQNERTRSRWDMTDRQGQWRRDGKDFGTRDWQRDNGWESRRRATVDDGARHSIDNAQASTSNTGGPNDLSERSWEPAPAWRQKEQANQVNTHGGNNSNANTRAWDNQGQKKQRNKNKKKNKQKQQNSDNHANGTATGSNAVKSQREDRGWRQDDTHLNK